MKFFIAGAILAILLSASTGCTMTDLGANMVRTARMFRPRPFDETTDPKDKENVDDEWAKLMSEARPNTEREREPDRFFFEKIMSPQARSIERNLGFE